MVTGRQGVKLPYPWIDGLTHRQQEQIFADFQAVGLGSGGTRWATRVIAASNSNARSKAAADYVCSGSGDEVTIQLAIDALKAGGAGGRIVFLEGTFVLGAAALITGFSANLIAFQGMGAGGWEQTTGITIFRTSADVPILSCNGPGGPGGAAVLVEGIQFKSTAATSRAIAARDISMMIRHCSFITGAAGALSQTNSLGTSAGTMFTDNYCYTTGTDDVVGVGVGPGIFEPATVSRNIVIGGGTGIFVGNDVATVPSYVVADNIVQGAQMGIKVNGNNIKDCTVVGNIIKSCTTGISVGGYTNVVAGNVVDTCTTGIISGGDSQHLAIMSNQVTSYSGVAYSLAGTAIRPTVIANKASSKVGGASACTIAAGVTNAFVGYNDFEDEVVTDGGTGSTVVTPASSLPVGGATDYVLKKNSATNFDTSWALDPALAKFGAVGDLLVGLGVGSAQALSLARAVMGPAWAGQILVTDPTSPVGVRWGPTITVGSTAPTSPLAGDIWMDTT